MPSSSVPTEKRQIAITSDGYIRFGFPSFIYFYYTVLIIVSFPPFQQVTSYTWSLLTVALNHCYDNILPSLLLPPCIETQTDFVLASGRNIIHEAEYVSAKIVFKSPSGGAIITLVFFIVQCMSASTIFPSFPQTLHYSCAS